MSYFRSIFKEHGTGSCCFGVALLIGPAHLLSGGVDFPCMITYFGLILILHTIYKERKFIFYASGIFSNDCFGEHAHSSTNSKPGNPEVNDRINFIKRTSLNLAKNTLYELIFHCRVPCQRQGGVRFTIEGNPHFNLVTVWNVGGAGDVTNVQVRGDGEASWIPLRRNWGQKWETNAVLVGKALSFRVTVGDGRSSVSRRVAPQNWQFGQTYEGKNFR